MFNGKIILLSYCEVWKMSMAMEKEETEQTFDFFCTFIIYFDIITKENEDNRFIGGISWIILN